MRYVLVALLPKELNDLINPLREHFENGVSTLIPPHVTLLFPFETVNAGDLEDEIKNICANLSAFNAKINGVNFFNRIDGGKVLYLSVGPENLFRDGFDKLNDGLQKTVKFETGDYPQNTLPEYVPHITVCMNGDEKTLEYLKQNTENLTGREFTVDRIVLLSNEKKGAMWKVERVYYPK